MTLYQTSTNHTHSIVSNEFTDTSSEISNPILPFGEIVGDSVFEIPMITFVVTNPIEASDIAQVVISNLQGGIRIRHSKLEGQLSFKDEINYMNQEKSIWEPLLEEFKLNSGLEWVWNEKYILFSLGCK